MGDFALHNRKNFPYLPRNELHFASNRKFSAYFQLILGRVHQVNSFGCLGVLGGEVVVDMLLKVDDKFEKWSISWGKWSISFSNRSISCNKWLISF